MIRQNLWVEAFSCAAIGHAAAPQLAAAFGSFDISAECF